MASLYQLPADLPVPVDDGGAAHLPGMRLPDLALPSAAGRLVNLVEFGGRRAVLYFYPRTGRPGETAGPEWDGIPGARG
jgi:hypothetical protein